MSFNEGSLQLEITGMQASSDLKRALKVGFAKYGQTVSMWRNSQTLNEMFGSTYTCESSFSRMNGIKQMLVAP